MEFKTLEEKFLYDYAKLEDENLELKERIKELENELNQERIKYDDTPIMHFGYFEHPAYSTKGIRYVGDICGNTEENKND